MKLTKNYFECRAAAMKWLDRDVPRRNYADGVRLLQRSGYKPHVAALLLRKGEQEWTVEKLAVCLRELIQMYYNPDDPRYDSGAEDVDELNDREGATVPVQGADALLSEAKSLKTSGAGVTPMPEVIQAVTRAFADAFKQRAKQKAVCGNFSVVSMSYYGLYFRR